MGSVELDLFTRGEIQRSASPRRSPKQSLAVAGKNGVARGHWFALENLLAGLGIPDAQGFILTARYDLAAVRRNIHGQHVTLVAFQDEDFLFCRNVPDVD